MHTYHNLRQELSAGQVEVHLLSGGTLTGTIDQLGDGLLVLRDARIFSHPTINDPGRKPLIAVLLANVLWFEPRVAEASAE